MADLERLLEKTSRTFAIAIPWLDEPVRAEVTIAYLLFRIADTFEDAERWPRVARERALAEFCGLLERPGALTADDHACVAAWVSSRPCDDASYLELLAETPAVLSALSALSPTARSIVTRHARRTCEGMARVVARGGDDGHLSLATVEELRDYCYIVAGIVGELLTELFLAEVPRLEAVRVTLEREAVAFGEGLQLVNILKDQRDDARDGRAYLPSDVDRAEVFALARNDLERARSYVGALQVGGAPRGVVGFCALPVLLAREALAAVEAAGPGSKVPREKVLALMEALQAALDAGEPAADVGGA